MIRSARPEKTSEFDESGARHCHYFKLLIKMAANKAIKEFLRRSLFSHETRKSGHHMSESSKNALR